MSTYIQLHNGQVLELAAAQAEEDHVDESGEAHELEAADHGGNNPILPAWNEVIWGGLAFAILVALMWKFAFPSVQKAMEARTERIRESLDDAERTKAEAGQILEEYQRQLNDAKSEAGRIIEEARQTAEQMRRDMMSRAEAEVAELRERSRQEIEAASARAVADVQSRVGDMAVGLAERIVESNLDREAQNRLIESYINQVGAQS